jgi:hypothetical protein
MRSVLQSVLLSVLMLGCAHGSWANRVRCAEPREAVLVRIPIDLEATTRSIDDKRPLKTVEIGVCAEEVAVVSARLGLSESPADVVAAQELAAALIYDHGAIDRVPEDAWPSVQGSLEAIQMGRKIKALFESTDNEIDRVDNNL